MKLSLVMAVAALTAGVSPAADVAWIFTTPVRPEPSAYAVFRAAVEGGTPGTLYVGVPAPAFTDVSAWCRVDALDGVAPGVYQCDRVGGIAVMELRRPVPVPVVAVPHAVYLFAAPRSACPGGNCPR